MDRAPPTELDSAVFEANLTALREADAALAERMAQQPIAPAAPVTGRDGSITFRVPGPDGRTEWFGRTSTPTVSGPALLESLDHGTAGVALPGIGQGIEAKLLCESLPPHRAVFVLEPDPARLALALRLHALAEPIRNGKLVLISSDDLAATLTDFLSDNLAYLLPERMLSRPWMSPAELDVFTTAIERAGSVAVDRRAEQAATIEQTLKQLPHEDDAARVVGLALHPSASTARRADELARAAEHAGVAWRHCIMDSPANGHVLAHLRTVAEHRPDSVVLLDHTRGDLPTLFAERLPVVSWFDTPTFITDGLADRVGPTDQLCPASPHLARQFADAGVDRERMHVVPLAAAESDWLDPNASLDVPDAYRCDVAVFADGADLNPATWGLVLSAHDAAYSTLVELIRGEADRFHAHDAGSYVKDIEKRLELDLGDERVRTVLCRQAAQIIGPTICCLTVVRALISVGLRVRLYGDGWDTHDVVRDIRHRPLDGQAEEHLAVAGCRLVVHVDPSGQASREVFHAAAAGRPVLYRKHPFDAEPGGMATLLTEGVEALAYEQAREVATLAKRLLNDKPAAARLAAAAQQRTRTDHTLAHRLCKLREIALKASSRINGPRFPPLPHGSRQT